MSFLKNQIRWLRAHAFVRKAFIMQVSGGLASVLQSLAGVVLARVLKPELFGQYSLAFSVASVASIVLASGFQDALMPLIARGHARGNAEEVVLNFSYWAKWVGTSVIFVAVVAMLLPLATAHLYGSAAVGVFAGILLVASFVSTTVFSFASVAAQVAGRITVLAWLSLTDMIVRYGVATALTVAGAGVLGASTGHLFGAVIILLISIPVYSFMRTRDKLFPRLSDVIRHARTVSWRLHLSRGIWVWIDRNFGTIYQALPVAMVGLFIPIASVAFFKLAFGYVNTGMAVLGPVSLLLNTEFAKIQVMSPRRLRSAFIRVSLMGMAIAGGVTLFAIAVGPWVFRLLYGSAYMPGVQLVYGLVVYGFILGLGIGLGPMWRTLNKVRTSVAINCGVLGVGIPLGLLLMHMFGSWGGVATVTLWYGAAHFGSFFYVLRELNHESGKVLPIIV